MTENRKDCPMRHENGNCTVSGGFCTAVNDPICEALHNAFDCGYRSALRQQETATDRHQMTNADRIRSMSDEELAGFLSFNGDVEYCHAGMCKAGETCRICCLRWLQMTAEEDDHA